jgi:D-arabinose 1-dehydrogenase-like Zn-dependent alcohol dehydrogenase
MVNSCLECDACQNNVELYCMGVCVWSYNSLVA